MNVVGFQWGSSGALVGPCGGLRCWLRMSRGLYGILMGPSKYQKGLSRNSPEATLWYYLWTYGKQIPPENPHGIRYISSMSRAMFEQCTCPGGEDSLGSLQRRLPWTLGVLRCATGRSVLSGRQGAGGTEPRNGRPSSLYQRGRRVSKAIRQDETMIRQV